MRNNCITAVERKNSLFIAGKNQFSTDKAVKQLWSRTVNMLRRGLLEEFRLIMYEFFYGNYLILFEIGSANYRFIEWIYSGVGKILLIVPGNDAKSKVGFAFKSCTVRIIE